ncbi:HD domain-containing protein [Ammonifex thiophilus]|nr:HD domain-containing protein [Ammonifex thiophilus]
MEDFPKETTQETDEKSKEHTFRDPIHGFIRVSTAERKIIDHPVFQRLRRIKQLGLGYYVFHGAEHTRFGHSLGAMEVATRAFDRICEKNKNFGWKEEEKRHFRQLLRLAALLHDIGHPPFSHAAEDLLPPVKYLGGGLKSQENRPATHEDYTAALILASDLKVLIEEHFGADGITAERVCKLIEKHPQVPAEFQREGFIDPSPLLVQLISGEIDADRMDYLLRDAYFCGVAYGAFDIDRVLDCLTAYVSEDRAELAVEEDGLFAVEGLLLARYYMYLQVYFHPVRRAYDYILSEYLRTTLPGGTWPADLGKFLEEFDAKIESRISEDRLTNRWAERLFSRRHLKLIKQTSIDAKKEQVELFRVLGNLLKEKGVREVYLDEGKENYLTKLKPARYMKPEEKTEGSWIHVLGRDRSKKPDLLQERSLVIQRLDYEVRMCRLYCHEEDVKKAKEILEGFLNGWQKGGRI